MLSTPGSVQTQDRGRPRHGLPTTRLEHHGAKAWRRASSSVNASSRGLLQATVGGVRADFVVTARAARDGGGGIG